jgi:hypothetical protein
MDRSYVGQHGGQQQHNIRKRGAEDAFEVQSGISNHFKKLRLRELLPLCLRSSTNAWRDNAPAQIHTVERPHAPAPAADQGDLMPVDETPSKVYIHDLAAEIAQIEAEEPKDMFLFDIDKRVSALPAKLFQSSSPNPNTQLVLYREPSSISIPEEEDAVRKAIIDARKRVRERQELERKNEEEQGRINGNRRFWSDGSEQNQGILTNGSYVVHGVEPNAIGESTEHDPDVMDID